MKNRIKKIISIIVIISTLTITFNATILNKDTKAESNGLAKQFADKYSEAVNYTGAYVDTEEIVEAVLRDNPGKTIEDLKNDSTNVPSAFASALNEGINSYYKKHPTTNEQQDATGGGATNGVGTGRGGTTSNTTTGTTPTNTSLDYSTMKNQADNFISTGKNNQAITIDEAIESLIPIGRILVGIAGIVLVIVGMILGIKYMMAGADEKAKLKEKLIWYVIAIVFVFGAVGIYNIVVNIIEKVLE